MHNDSKKLFDGLGRVAKVCNPYQKTGAGADTATENCADSQAVRMKYDGLGRVATTTNADGTTQTSVYAGTDSTHTDEAGNPRTLKRDAQGRLTSVIETVGGVSLTTSYPSYDLLDNLLTVTQGTQTSRTFAYDKLGRLTSAFNPESGTVDYSYDNNGNLLTRSGARSAVLTIAYDDLDRPLTKTYSGVATPTVTLAYDTCTNGKGRVCSVTNTASGTTFTYDLLGRAATSKQTTGGADYNFSYAFNRADGLTSVTYPSARVVTTSYDGAGRPTTAASGATTYANGVQYWPHGAMKQMTLGNGLIEQAAYNERLQMRSVQVGVNGTATAAWKAEYCWGTLEPGCATNAPKSNNGNLQAQTITAPGFTVTQKYGYDGLNRILKAEELAPVNPWTQEFVYDNWGNRALKSTSNYVDQVCTPLASGTTVPFNSANNQWTAGGVVYDGSGNFASGCGKSLAYDGENRVATVNSTAVVYSYDGQDRRVKMVDNGVSPAATTVWVYDAFGGLAAEYRTGAVGVAALCTTCYVTTDHLGSTRVVTGAGTATGDGTNLVKSRHDYLPFGEEIPAGWGARTVGMGYALVDGVRPRFTGKERDAETGLDYFGARYFAAAQGRFTSPDRPFADQFVSNPQSWNLYSYVRNNPLRYVDDTGQGAISAVVKNIALGNARRRGVARAWAAERELVRAGKPGTRRGGRNAAERQELIETGRIKGYEGAHINGVAKNDARMAENPDNIEFLTRDEHFEEHGFDWRNPTKGDLLSRSSMGILPFLQRWDQEERNLTGPNGCGGLCASPDSKWALINPFNNILDFPAMFRALFPDSSKDRPKPRELKPDVQSRICFEDGSCTTQ